jgi:hypothetical protein
MPKICEQKRCRTPTQEPGDRWCRTHGLLELRRIKRANPAYFQPLKFRSIDGPVRLSDHSFLLAEDEAEDGQTGTSPSRPYSGDS